MRRLAVMILLLTAGCSSAGAPASAPAPAAVPLESITFAPALQVDLARMERTSTGVYYRDLVEGQGPPVRGGQSVQVHFAGFLPDGTQFEAVAPPQNPVRFELGRRDVIRGWDSGIVGMRAGGQRQLVIPPAQGYGERGMGRVPPNATLVFVIKLVSAR